MTAFTEPVRGSGRDGRARAFYVDLGQILFLREQILRNGRVEIW